MKDLDSLPILVSLLFILLIVFGFTLIKKDSKNAIKESGAFCGVISPKYNYGEETETIKVSLGKSLFKSNCAQCHNKNMKDDLTGPALGGVTERWAGRDTLLFAWIRNSQAVIADGDKYSVELYEKWNKTLMNPFPNLTDDDIKSILLYVDGQYKYY